MKKFLISLLAVLLFVGSGFSADEKVYAYEGTVERSVGCRVLDLNTRNTVSSYDTIATTKINLYGPYDLTSKDGGPAASSFTVFFDAVTGTTPTAAFGYQILSGTSITDTTSNWTLADTLDTTPSSSNHTLSGTGKSIVFIVDNYDGTETQIPGMLRVLLEDDVSHTKMYR